MALVDTLVHHLSASMRAEATRMFSKLLARTTSAPTCTIPSQSSQPWLRATGSTAYPGPWLLWGWGLYNPIACPRAAHVHLHSSPGNFVTLRTAKLRHRDTCRLTVPHTTPWHGHHGPHYPFTDKDDAWPAAMRECLNQCAAEHLHYCRREHGPTDPPWAARRPGPSLPHHRHAGPPPEAHPP